MVHYVVYKTIVTDQHLFNRTGMIGRWAERIKNEAVAFVRKEAPSSLPERPNKSNWTRQHQGDYPSGSMKRNIEGEALRVGPRQINTKITVDVPYALYVIKGTGTIFAKSARGEGGRFATLETTGAGFRKGGMYLPANPPWSRTRRQRVRGQRANNFLGRGMAATARKHPSLAGFRRLG